MQLATQSVLSYLAIFISSPVIKNALQLFCIPSLYNVLELERDHVMGVYSDKDGSLAESSEIFSSQSFHRTDLQCR